MPNEPFSISWRRALVLFAVCSAFILLYPFGPAVLPASSAHVVLDLSPAMDSEEVPPKDDFLIQIVTRERGAVPRVLIYHTHTYEAYEPTPENPYVATEKWRTKDAVHNVCRVGELLAEILRDRYGMDVVHDVTEHELPDLNSAYTRSLKTLDGYTQRGETFDLYIDLHRD
nr:stage II sporulation protein P [Clostridia bacterium]